MFKRLPATLGHLLVLGELVAVDADHGLAKIFGDGGQNLGVVEVGDGLDYKEASVICGHREQKIKLTDGAGALGRIAGLENAGTDKDTIASQLLCR